MILRGDTNLFGAVPGRAPSVDLKKKKKKYLLLIILYKMIYQDIYLLH